MRDIVNTTNAVELAISHEQSCGMPISETDDGVAAAQDGVAAFNERRVKTAERATRSGVGIHGGSRARPAMFKGVLSGKANKSSAAGANINEND